MRFSSAIAAIGLVLASMACAQSPLTPRRLSDTLATRILLLGQEVDLKQIPGGDKQPVFVRLYRVGEEGTCVDETHWVCSYDYYAVVSDYGESVEGSLYWLGRVGELLNFAWLPAHGRTATLSATVLNYPETVLRRQTNLKRSARAVVLELSAQAIALRGRDSR